MELWDIHSEALSTQIEYLILYNKKGEIKMLLLSLETVPGREIEKALGLVKGEPGEWWKPRLVVRRNNSDLENENSCSKES